MIKSNCYTQYLLKMGLSQAVQYNTVLQFSRAQNQYHILERPLLNIDIFVFFSSNYLPRPMTSLLMYLTVGLVGAFLKDLLCLSKSVRHHL